MQKLITSSAGAVGDSRSWFKRAGLLFCIVGPAGGGKTTLWEQLMADFKGSIELSISVTSRTPRPQEKEGVHYYFVSRSQFEEMVRQEKFFEWEETHGNLYGTLKSTLDGALSAGTDLLLEVDIRGAMRFKRSYPGNTVVTFVIPPSGAELAQRISNRSKVTQDELQRRLATAEREYQALLESATKPEGVDYILINDGFEVSYAQLRSILVAERQRLRRIDNDSLKNLCKL